MKTIVASSPTDLMKLNAEGKAIWSRNVVGENQNRVNGVTAIASSGLIYGWSTSYPQFGWMTTVWRMNGDGSGETQLDTAGDVSQVGPLAANKGGDVAWTASYPGGSLITVRRANGTQFRIQPRTDHLIHFYAPGLDDGGHVIGGALAQGDVQLGATFVQQGMALMRFGSDGALDWSTSLGRDSHGVFRTIDTTDLGTVVAFGEFWGRVTWGASTFDIPSDAPAELVLVAEANGTPRFAIRLPSEDPNAGGGEMGLDPSGRLAVAWRAPDGAGKVRFYNLLGQQLWERTFPGNVEPNGVAFLGHDVVVAGRFTGTSDFGQGAVSANGDDGFLLRLAP